MELNEEEVPNTTNFNMAHVEVAKFSGIKMHKWPQGSQTTKEQQKYSKLKDSTIIAQIKATKDMVVTTFNKFKVMHVKEATLTSSCYLKNKSNWTKLKNMCTWGNRSFQKLWLLPKKFKAISC